jgi:hypothetical protein
MTLQDMRYNWLSQCWADTARLDKLYKPGRRLLTWKSQQHKQRKNHYLTFALEDKVLVHPQAIHFDQQNSVAAQIHQRTLLK